MTNGYEENWFYAGFFFDVLKVNKKYCGLDIRFFKWNELSDKTEYVLHIRNLKQALNHRLILKKIHKVIKFNEDAWLKPYIGMNTDLRKKAKNDFKKDFFKLMNNAIFGKTMENLRKQILDLSQQKEEEIIWCQNPVTIQQSFSQNI